MTRKLSQLLALVFVLLAAAAGTSAHASHLRGTSLTWTPTGTPGQVTFTLQYSQRTSAGGCSTSPCSVGSKINVAIYFGDGGSGTVSATVTSVNTAQDWFSATGTVTHTYAGNGPYTAYYSNCCRVSTLVSGHDQTINMQTTVSPNSGNHAPVVSMPAIISVPLQATTGFVLSASDLDRDPLSFRLSTGAEMYSLTFSCAAQQPPGLTVAASTGQVTWDTTKITKAGCGYAAPKAGDLWPVQFMVQDLDANGNVKSKVPLDVILQFVSSTEPVPTLTLSQSSITVKPGTPVTFTATGDDPGATNPRITLTATGLPVGASATNLNSALTPPVSSTFTWTPTEAQSGTSYVITYTATNDTFEQVLKSASIFVQSILPPDVSCPASFNAAAGSTALPVTVSDPQGDAITVIATLDGTQVDSSNVDANAGSVTLPFTADVESGTHTYLVRATNSENQTNTCSTTVTVTQTPQQISFSPLTAITYGSASSVNLVATGGASGNPVTFSVVSGPATINGSQLIITGAGTITVAANQAGSASYTAAPQVTQSMVVNPAPLTVSVVGTPTKTYDATTTAALSGANFQVSGVASGDNIVVNQNAGNYASANAGAQTVTAALTTANFAATTGNLANYVLPASASGAGQINPAVASVSPAAASKVYGTADPALTGTLAGFIASDNVTAAYTRAAGETVLGGPYSITATLSPAAVLSNYNITYNTAALTISPAPASVVVNAASKTYGSADPALTGTLSGFLPADGVTAAYTRTAGEAVAGSPYAITASLSPASVLSNYTVTNTPAQFTITAAPLTITAGNGSMTYGGAVPAITPSFTGLVGPDSAASLGAVTCSTTATSSSAVGTYPTSCTGAADSNYVINYAGGNVVVNQAALVVTPASATRPYGSANPALTGTVTGIVNNDPITATYGTAATSGSDVGTYTITAQLSDPAAKLGNYAVTLNTGTLTVVKANQTTFWATPAAITYAMPLTAAQLNATVSVPGPSAAGAITYTPAAGTVLDAGAQTLTVNVAGTSNYNAATASVTLTVNKAQPVFASLSAPTITFHTGTTTLSGTLVAPTAVPAGQQVAITLNGVAQTATVGANGSFSTTFNTATLPVVSSGYTVSYAFAGNQDFLAASASSQLTVSYAVCYAYDTTQVKKIGSTYPIKVTVCDVNGQNVATANTVVTGIGWGTSSPAYTPLPDAGNSNGNGTFRNTGSFFMWNLKTTGMPAGRFNTYFSISGDPVLHLAPFAVE